MNNKQSFLDFLKKSWGMFSFWLPVWVYIIVSSFIYSSKFLADGFLAFLAEFIGSAVFITVLLFIIYLLKEKVFNKK